MKLSERVADWRTAHLSEKSAVALLCVLVGVMAGTGAWILKSLIRIISTSFTWMLHTGSFNWLLFVAPMAGIIVTAIILRRIFHRHISDGTDNMIDDLGKHHFGLPHQLMYQPILACSLTIGCGGSAGSEGPIAYAAGAMGSNIARFFRLRTPLVRLMLICGAGAGIAAIFKAPLGGFFFVLEVMGATLTTLPVLALSICCLVAGATAYFLSGCHTDLFWAASHMDFPWHDVWMLLPIGILIGLYSLWYAGCSAVTTKVLTRFRSPLVKNICAGAALGLCVMLFPTLFGEGYDSMARVLAGDTDSIRRFTLFESFFDTPWLIPGLVGCILLVKGIVVTLTNRGGGVAGSFAPTLFAGCMAGLLLSFGSQAIGLDMPPMLIAYLCMAGAMAGIIRAPFMATFITVEITSSYQLLVPVAIVAFISFFTVKMAARLRRQKA